MPTLREALRSDAKKLGITMKEVAETLGVIQQTISDWYKLNRIPEGRQEDLVTLFGEGSDTAKGIRTEFDEPVPMPFDAGRISTSLHRAISTQVPADRRTFSSRQAGEAQMFDAMRPYLPKDRLRAVIDIEDFRYRFTYASNKVIANVAPILAAAPQGDSARPTMISTNRYTRALVELSLLKRHSQSSDLKYVLFVIPPELGTPEVNRLYTRLLWEASVFEIEAIPVESYAEAGRIIVQMETGIDTMDDFDYPPDLDEIYD